MNQTPSVDLSEPAAQAARPAREGVAGQLLVALLVAGAATYIGRAAEVRQLLLFGLGLLLGLALYHAAFGFTTAWRRLVVSGRGEALRAQMLMLAIGVCLFFPVLASGELWGNSVAGYVRPLGWSVLFGAFIFGIGMQLGNGCASGNLYHLGGGQIRALPSMIGFMIGALWATADYEWWTTLPQLAPFSVIDYFGVIWAIILNLAVFLAIALVSKFFERPPEEPEIPVEQSLLQRVLAGPWPFYWGAIALALLNFMTLFLTGRPWSVAVAYPLWGARAYETLGLERFRELEIDFWAYWMQPGREEALMEPLVNDTTTVMNAGIIAGALVAAALARKLSLEWRLPWQNWLAAIIGGLMLGYGATIAFGCNIGAYFSGIVSGSLHGWLWLVAAFVGSAIGTQLRPWFRLPNA